MPAELYQSFYQIATLQVIHALACNVRQERLPVEDAFAMFFEPDALKVLFHKSTNLFWFWSLVRESIEFARGELPIWLNELEGARQRMSVRMADRGVQLGQPPADMAVHEMGVAMALGTVIMMQKRQQDGTYRYLIANPMFSDKQSQPVNQAPAGMEPGDTKADTAVATETPSNDKLLNADPDARSLQKLEPPNWKNTRSICSWKGARKMDRSILPWRRHQAMLWLSCSRHSAKRARQASI